jgi:hypothetical protein
VPFALGAGLSALFGEFRVWDTEHNNGVLIYLMFAKRHIEIVADRGRSLRVAQETWRAISDGLAQARKSGHHERGLLGAADQIHALLKDQFAPMPGANNPNELSKRPQVRCALGSRPPCAVFPNKKSQPGSGVGFFVGSRLNSLLAVPAQRCNLSCHGCEFALRLGKVNIAFGVFHGLFRKLLGFAGLGLVKILAPNRGVSQHGHCAGLNLENPAGDKDKFLGVVVCANDANSARTDAGDQRGVPGINTQFAHLARQGHKLGLTGEDGLFG